MRRNSVSQVSKLPKASAIVWRSDAPACPLPPRPLSFAGSNGKGFNVSLL